MASTDRTFSEPEGLNMGFFQGLLSLVGLDREKKRVDSEWDEAVKNMQQSTQKIHEERQSISKLITAKDRLIQSRENMMKAANHKT